MRKQDMNMPDQTAENVNVAIPGDMKSEGVSRILISEQQIRDEIAAIAKELDEEYAGDGFHGDLQLRRLDAFVGRRAHPEGPERGDRRSATHRR
jgi:hypothetical protein